MTSKAKRRQWRTEVAILEREQRTDSQRARACSRHTRSQGARCCSAFSCWRRPCPASPISSGPLMSARSANRPALAESRSVAHDREFQTPSGTVFLCPWMAFLYTYSALPPISFGVPHGSGGEADPIFCVDSRESV